MILKVEDLKVLYGDRCVIENFSFEVDKGEMIAISGASGKGKSSLLYTIGMLHEEYLGDIILFDKKNPKINSKEGKEILKNNISFIFQNYALVDNKTVRYNLNLANKIAKSNTSIEEALEFVGLSDKINSKVVELSGGEQQRIALARAFIKKSDLLLADEPTGSLDNTNRDNILKLFKKLQNQGMTILIVTHDEYVKSLCDKVIQL